MTARQLAKPPGFLLPRRCTFGEFHAFSHPSAASTPSHLQRRRFPIAVHRGTIMARSRWSKWCRQRSQPGFGHKFRAGLSRLARLFHSVPSNRRERRRLGRLRISFFGPRPELLEARRLLAVLSDSGTSTLSIALAASENLAIVSNGTSYTLSSNQNFTNGGVSNTGDFSGFGTTSFTLQSSGISR
jgi:hypothetical protein